MIKQFSAHCLLQLYKLFWQQKISSLTSCALRVYISLCILAAIMSIVSDTVIRSCVSSAVPPVKYIKSNYFPSYFRETSQPAWLSSFHQHLCCTSELLRWASQSSMELTLSLRSIQYHPYSISPPSHFSPYCMELACWCDTPSLKEYVH